MTLYIHSDGWIIDKEKVALYAFNDKTQETLIDDIYCEDAVSNLYAELEGYKRGLYAKADKNNLLLKQALQYFTLCMIVKSGLVKTTVGNITSESIDGMSVGYGTNQNQANQINSPIPQNWCDMAQDMIKKFYNQKYGHFGKRTIIVSNFTDKLFDKTYDKYRETTNWRN